MISILWFEVFGVVVITLTFLQSQAVEMSCLNIAMQ